ncbi:hypothetical protein BDZ97DRAFT_1755135 [Flammula alnicola]|nr:hypothetical protein BDZ97DRAFT_1755135 [Flammula alnicola]
MNAFSTTIIHAKRYAVQSHMEGVPKFRRRVQSHINPEIWEYKTIYVEVFRVSFFEKHLEDGRKRLDTTGAYFVVQFGFISPNVKAADDSIYSTKLLGKWIVDTQAPNKHNCVSGIIQSEDKSEGEECSPPTEFPTQRNFLDLRGPF